MNKQYTQAELDEIRKILSFENEILGANFDLNSQTPLLDNLIDELYKIDHYVADEILDIKRINYEDKNFEDAEYLGYRYSKIDSTLRVEAWRYSIVEIEISISPIDAVIII